MGGFDADGQEKMLKLHNEKRAKIANGEETGALISLPTGSNMRQLTWNEDLAKVAQQWADQCIFEHDQMDQRAISDDLTVGQNIYIDFSPKLDESTVPIENAIEGWYNEVKDYNGPVDAYVFTHATGHFTQLVWAETSEVGCGYTIWKEDDKWSRMIVCNYADAGNWEGEPMYAEGAPCSACDGACSADGVLCE